MQADTVLPAFFIAMFSNFEFLGRELSAYAVCVFVGVIVVTLFICLEPGKHGMSEYRAIVMHMVGAAGVFIGMHLMYGVTMYKKLFALVRDIGSLGSFAELLTRLNEIFGGAVFYGGLLGGLLAAAICYRKMKLTPEYSDLGACSIPLFHFFGRIGCFLTGCCYGVECPVGFTYHHAIDEAANGVSRFPVQLLEAGFNVFLFILLLSLFKRGKLKGRLLRLYLVLYPAFRFADEFLRGDNIRGSLWGLSTSQWISLMILAAVLAYTIAARGKKTQKSF